MSYNFVPTDLRDHAVMVLKKFRNQGMYDPSLFLLTLNRYESLHNVGHTNLDALITNPKSKYHLLYSLAGARQFHAQLINISTI